jgi:hypothetical protein
MRAASEVEFSDARGACIARIENAQTFLTQSEVDEMVATYASGMTAAQVGGKFGVHESTVRAHAKKHGLFRHLRE